MAAKEVMTGTNLGRGTLTPLLCLFALGLMGEAQQGVDTDHRHRFQQYKDLRNIRDADPSTLEPVGHPFRLVRVAPQGDVDVSGRPAVDYLREYACAADVVATVTPRAAQSDFTAEGTFIFTTFEVRVESVLRGHTERPGSGIRVIWPGGSLIHNGRLMSTTDDSYRLLTTGRKYLLFLRRIGEGDFETMRETAGYDLTGEQARGLGAGTLRETLKSPRLLEIAQAAVSGCDR